MRSSRWVSFRIRVGSTVRRSDFCAANALALVLPFLLVAITRAQALLVVIGDAFVLSVDPMWRGFMNYVYSRGGWKGDAPTWDTNASVRTEGDYAAEMSEAAAAEMDALMARLMSEGEDIEGAANVDQPFQEVE